MCNLPVYILIALKLLTFVNDHSTVLLNLTSLSLITLQYCFTPTHYASSYSFYSFYSPKSDTCKTCDTFVVKVDSKEDAAIKRRLSASWDLHKCKAERAYAVLKGNTALAQSDPKVDMITFDLQQSLPTPRISTGNVFYKRQLWTYNLGIHCCSSGQGFMHVWDESVASQEVGSCIMKHLKETNNSPANRLILYSEACGGQNRNIHLVTLWLYVVACDDFPYEQIDHKFMVSGHSFLPNDRDFGGIERAKRVTQHVFVPDDWRTLIRYCS